jgi:pyruvate formate lyase activating enzyme
MNGAGTDPLVTDIHHFALDDGPGIRTTVFFKGCPLACAWCHNPECQSADPEIAFYSQFCLGCGDCYAVCPNGAIRGGDNALRIDREACTACGACADVCSSTALRMLGRRYSLPELMETLFKDRIFFEVSGGGVTFSGGEPTLFLDYLAAAAKALKTMGIQTALQTSGYFDLTRFTENLLPFVDLIYFDFKLFDSRAHRVWTGQGNELILDNFIGLARQAPAKLIPRIPLIPGITDREENLLRIGEFVKGAGYTDCVLLGYNGGGLYKRGLIGKPLPEGLRGVRYDPGAVARCRRIISSLSPKRA